MNPSTNNGAHQILCHIKESFLSNFSYTLLVKTFCDWKMYEFATLPSIHPKVWFLGVGPQVDSFSEESTQFKRCLSPMLSIRANNQVNFTKLGAQRSVIVF